MLKHNVIHHTSLTTLIYAGFREGTEGWLAGKKSQWHGR